MSHLSQIKRNIKCKPCLLKALKDMGFEPVEHEEPVRIRDMYSRLNGKAHIVVPGEQMGIKSDLGFLYDGQEYVLVTDLWELNRLVPAELRAQNPRIGFQSWFSAYYAVASISIQTGASFKMGEFRVCTTPGEELKFTITEQEAVSVSM